MAAVEKQPPSLLGLSNYAWNMRLSNHAAEKVRKIVPNIPIIMGGPNIRLDEDGVRDFLRINRDIDLYCLYNSEVSVSKIIGTLLSWPLEERTSENLREAKFSSCFSLDRGKLHGDFSYEPNKDLDFIPSPYLDGSLDSFLDDELLPMFESNRGCPYSCTFCYWGVDALNKIQLFGIERIKAELDYVTSRGVNYPQLYFADANFGILKRDVTIAQHIRKLYEETHSFASIEVSWAKSSQDHVVDMGKALGHLTNTYIAFQSLDEDVLKAIKRKNISTRQLVSLIKRLKGFNHSSRTDILVGLPGETFESHLNSLDKALGHGIQTVLGGEIHLLPGTEMDSEEDRKKYSLKTKYRLFEGCSGIYQNEPIFELQEVVRSTSTMSEEEMNRLRVLRALFFGGATLGEHRPLISFLTHQGVRVTDLYRRVIENHSNNKHLEKALDWIRKIAAQEWYDTPEDALAFIRSEENRKHFFKSQAYVKLNFGFTAYLILNPEQYHAYYEILQKEILELVPEVSRTVISEIIDLCKRRNYLFRYINEHESSNTLSLRLSSLSLEALGECGYHTPKEETNSSDTMDLILDEVTANGIREQLRSLDGPPSIFNLTQIMQLFQRRFHMDPLLACEPSAFECG